MIYPILFPLSLIRVTMRIRSSPQLICVPGTLPIQLIYPQPNSSFHDVCPRGGGWIKERANGR